MLKDALTAIMREYDQQCAFYTDFTAKIEKLVIDLLEENSLRVHSITSRVKNKTSLRAKLDRSEQKYTKLNDVTDIAGIRIITFFADEVDKVAGIIQREFDIDQEHSVDKRALLDPDRFGYLSLHYVAKLPAARLQLTEYRRFSNCKVEIQIRSILQHTWAEIEHDLGYKSKQAVPKELRRRFFQLAGLLELADNEFEQIRDGLREYEAAVPQRITNAPALVSIDKASLWAFVKQSSLVHKIDRKIASVSESQVVEDEEYVTRDVDKLHYVGLETIADIDISLRKYEDSVVAFAESWLTDKYETLSAGISLFYLCYILVARKNSVKEAYDDLEKHQIGNDEERKSVAQGIISTYKRVTTKSG
jgi:putative GTP pyrophosphokinase